jgi:hypothetical protein
MSLARVLVLAALACLAVPPLAGAQGLGDASAKENQRRQQSKAPKAKTYTQEELPTLPPTANEGALPSGDAGAQPPGPGLTAGTTPASAPDEETTRAREEDRWRSRVAAARARVDKARRQHQALAAMNLVPGYEYVDAQGRTVIGSVEQLQHMTATAKGELDAAEKALDDVLEEARRANVPPGWLR